MCRLPFASYESLRRKGEVQTAHALLRFGELRARFRAASHEQVRACKSNDNDYDGIGGDAERFADANLKEFDDAALSESADERRAPPRQPPNFSPRPPPPPPR